MSSSRFRLVLIKPSHYDDKGYVLQWVRSSIPSNTLAALYGIALDCAKRQVLGPDVSFEIDPYDETNTVVPIPKIIADITRDGHGLVGLVGVQTNQFPRAVDLAQPFLKAKIPVAMGGGSTSAGVYRCCPPFRMTFNRHSTGESPFLPVKRRTTSINCYGMPMATISTPCIT